MNNNITFTAYLNDEYSKKFDKLADGSDAAVKEVVKDLDTLAKTGNRVARSIDAIDKRINALNKVKKMTIDTNAIKAAQQEIKALQREKEKLEGNSSPSGSSMFGGMGKGFAIAGTAMAGLYAAKNGIQSAIEASMEREQQRISFEVLTGSKGAGNKLLSDIQQMAAATPFETNDLTKATQTLLGFGVAQERVLPVMKQLGDISGGNQERFQSLTLAYAQMSSTGRLMGQDLLQMVNAGFNPLNEISKQTGKNMATLKKEMEEGKITAAMVNNAIAKATSEGGKYYGMMDKQSQTTAGRLSTLKDNAHELAVVIGDKFKPEMDAAIGSLSDMVGTVKKWFEIPTSEKIKKEIDDLRGLQVKLNESNITENQRKDALEAIKNAYPDLLGKMDLEKDGLDKINGKLDEYIGKQRQRMAYASANEGLADKLSDLDKGRKLATKNDAIMNSIMGQINEPWVTDSRVSTDDKIRKAKAYFKSRSQIDYKDDGGFLSENANEAEKNYRKLTIALDEYNEGIELIVKNKSAEAEVMERQARIDKLIGIDPKKQAKKGAGSSALSSDTTPMPSISGGTKITHLNISINNLVGGGVNVYSTNIKEGAAKIKDHVVEGLLTAVNDANLIAN